MVERYVVVVVVVWSILVDVLRVFIYVVNVYFLYVSSEYVYVFIIRLVEFGGVKVILRIELLCVEVV